MKVDTISNQSQCYYKLYSVDSAAQREAIVALTIPSTY